MGMKNPAEVIRGLWERAKQRQVDKGITILASETISGPMAQTWGESRRIMDQAGMDQFLTEYGMWGFAGLVGETDGRAILVNYSDGSRAWVSENAAYHADVMDAHTQWVQQQGGRAEKYTMHVSTDYCTEGGERSAHSKLSLLPLDDGVTLGELVEVTGNFRNFANALLKDRWGGAEL